MAEQGKSFYDQTATAAADLSDKQYHCMRFSLANTVNQSSLATDINYAGILQNTPESGEHATIRRGGKCKVAAGAATAIMLLITSNSSGRAVAVASGSNAMVIGRLLEAASNDGDIVTAEIFESPYVWAGLAI